MYMYIYRYTYEILVMTVASVPTTNQAPSVCDAPLGSREIARLAPGRFQLHGRHAVAILV